MPVSVTPVPVWEPDLPTLARALQAWRGFMEWNRTRIHATDAERQLAAAEINALDRITAALPAPATTAQAEPRPTQQAARQMPTAPRRAPGLPLPRPSSARA